MNLQVIQKQELNQDGSLFIHHLFKTIQGEGPFAGERSIFIRLSGCNLQCPDCDTDYTGQSNKMDPQQILAQVKGLEAGSEGNDHFLIVISGGEPFRQNIRPLVHTLIDEGYHVQIETNGTLFVDLWTNQNEECPSLEERLFVVCSPKTGKLNVDLLPHIDAFKYVLDHRSIDPTDGLPILALRHTAHPRVARPPDWYERSIYLSPADIPGSDEQDQRYHKRRNRVAVVQSALKFGYIAGLQLHKLMYIE